MLYFLRKMQKQDWDTVEAWLKVLAGVKHLRREAH